MTAPAPLTPQALDGLPARLEAMRDNYLMATPDKTETPWAIITQTIEALPALIAAARAGEEMRERLAEALRWLEWARPKAVIAMDDHRMARVKAGHNMTGTYRSGTTYVGIYQDEVDEIEASADCIERLRTALSKEQPQ